MADGDDRLLLDMFARECEAHLLAMRAHLADLAELAAGADEPARAVAAASIKASLHTLAGAARSVELLDLEYLCRSLESRAQACAGTGTPWPAAQLALFEAALDLAPALLAPTPRARNQMMALCGRCATAAAACACGAPS